MFQISQLVVILLTFAEQASSFSLSMTTKHQQAESFTKIKSIDRRNFGHQVAGAAFTIGISSVLGPNAAFAEDDDFVTTESGLKYKVIKEGSGKVPDPGTTVQAHYTGWLDDFDSAKKFDVSMPNIWILLELSFYS